MHLFQNGLIVFKTDLGALAVHRPPCQWNGTTTIDKGGTDQDKGKECCCIQGNEEALAHWPVNESSLQQGLIPLRRRNGRMMQPTRKPAYSACGVLCTTLVHLSTSTQ